MYTSYVRFLCHLLTRLNHREKGWTKINKSQWCQHMLVCYKMENWARQILICCQGEKRSELKRLSHFWRHDAPQSLLLWQFLSVYSRANLRTSKSEELPVRSLIISGKKKQMKEDVCTNKRRLRIHARISIVYICTLIILIQVSDNLLQLGQPS